MPGLYIDPASGSAITSSLGNILGGIATNMDPKTQAEAQELRQRTMQEDLNNQILRARIAGATGLPGTLGAANADPTAGQGSGVVGTLTSAAVPPAAPAGPAPGSFGGSTVNANFDPYARVLAGSYLNDPSMTNLTTGVNLGKDITTGPGTDYASGNTIAIARAAPQHVGPSDTLVIDPTKGNTPGNIITGQSSYGDTVARTTGAADPAAAAHDISVGADATVNLGKLAGIQKLYDTVVAPESTPGGVLSEGVIKNISDYLGIPIDRVAQMQVPGVKAEIRARFASMVSNLRDNMGQPMFKGGIAQIMQQFPDPDLDPARFHSAVNTLQTTLQQQEADGQAAITYYKNPTPQAYVDLLQQKAANAARSKAAFSAVGIQDAGGGEGAPAAAGAPAAGGGAGGAASPPSGATAGAGGGGGWPPPPEKSIARLRANPSLRGDFDAKYGPGAAARILGQ